MVDSIFSVDAGRRTGRVGRRERSQRRLVMPWARAIVTPSVSWARSCAALDMESTIQIVLSVGGVVEARLEPAAALELEREVVVVRLQPLADQLASGPLVPRNETRDGALGDVGPPHLERDGAAGAKPAPPGRVVDMDRAGHDRQQIAGLVDPGELALGRPAARALEH